MIRQEWELIKNYIDAKIGDEIDNHEGNGGIWLGVPPLRKAEEEIEKYLDGINPNTAGD